MGATVELGFAKLKGRFREIEGRYTSSTGLFVGKIKIAEYFYDGSTSRGSEEKMKVVSHVSNIKLKKIHYKTNDECETVCVSIARKYFELLKS